MKTIEEQLKGLPVEQLDTAKMSQEVSELVETDFAFDMNFKLIDKKYEYTQEEARKMADILGRIYSIAHCIHCRACQQIYTRLPN